MKEFISKWSNWWILNPKRKQLDDAFEKELNELIERELALRQPPVIKSVCGDCIFYLTCKHESRDKQICVHFDDQP